MRRAIPVALAIVAAVMAGAADLPAGRTLAAQLRVERAVLAAREARLRTALADLEEAYRRVEQLSADFARAERDGESVESLQLRDADLRLAEAELVLRVREAQRLRGEITAVRERVRALREAMREEALPGGRPDLLSGRWRLVVEPGGLEGFLELRLDGTLVTGVYELEGGWYGSFKGTLVAGKVRLERIDAELGFAAIFYGRLEPGDPPRLAGTWEGTNLSAGLPAGGSWMAERLPDEALTGGAGTE